MPGTQHTLNVIPIPPASILQFHAIFPFCFYSTNGKTGNYDSVKSLLYFDFDYAGL